MLKQARIKGQKLTRPSSSPVEYRPHSCTPMLAENALEATYPAQGGPITLPRISTALFIPMSAPWCPSANFERA